MAGELVHWGWECSVNCGNVVFIKQKEGIFSVIFYGLVFRNRVLSTEKRKISQLKKSVQSTRVGMFSHIRVFVQNWLLHCISLVVQQ